MLRDTKNKKTNKTNTDITRDQEDKRETTGQEYYLKKKMTKNAQN